MAARRRSIAKLTLGAPLVLLASSSVLANACGGQTSTSENVSTGGSPDGSSGSGGANADSGLDSIADVTAADHGVTKLEATKAFLKAVTCNSLCQPVEFAHFYGSQDDCVSSWFEVDLFSWPGVAMSPEQIMACLDAIDVTTCDALHATFLTSPPEVCRFKGTLAVDEPCMTSWQCQSGGCNSTLGSSPWFGAGICGKCAAATASLGQACDSLTPCEDFLLCLDGTCAKPKLAGEPCDASVYPSECAWPLVCADGSCVTRVADGEPCGQGIGACGYDSYCNLTTLVCESPGASQLGEPCWNLPDGVQKYCVAGTYCEHGVTLQSSQCVPQIPVGQPCPEQYADSCKGRAFCLGGLCRLLEPSLCE